VAKQSVRLPFAFTSAAFLLATTLGAAAQAIAPAKPGLAPPPPQVVPYDADLLRLAEILGSLHFLQQLCEGEGSSKWRDQMNALLDAEKPDDQRRARLIDRFNRGYESYRSVYRACTDSARLAISRYQDRGASIAATIGAKYGRG
jgi:uncharacterized protein (TIGR02301 family)